MKTYFNFIVFFALMTTLATAALANEPIEVRRKFNNLIIKPLPQKDGYVDSMAVTTMLEAAKPVTSFNIPAEMLSELREMVENYKLGYDRHARRKFRMFLRNIATLGASFDVNEVVAAVLKDTYLSGMEDLHFYAKKVKLIEEQIVLIKGFTASTLTLKTACEKPSSKCDKTAFEEMKMDLVKYPIVTATLEKMIETEQLKLQTQMSRRAHAIETISNVMKKCSDTAQTLTKNVK